MKKFENIISYGIICLIAIAVIILIIKNKYELAIAMAGILLTMFTPFFTKNLELEKHKQQLLYEKKYNAYSKYFKLFDEFYHSSQKLVIEIEFFNNGEHENEEEFEKNKNKVINLFQKFREIQSYLSMPGIEMLNFINEKIEKKIIEITNTEYRRINLDASMEENMIQVKNYITLLSELAQMLQEDLKINSKQIPNGNISCET